MLLKNKWKSIRVNKSYLTPITYILVLRLLTSKIVTKTVYFNRRARTVISKNKANESIQAQKAKN